MSLARPLVIGADGLIGRALCSALKEGGIRPLETTRRRSLGADQIVLDLADVPSSWPSLPAVSVAFLCAGVTSIASCEADPAGTYAINVSHTKVLLEQLAAAGVFVVYLSTNLVFDGSSPVQRSNDLKAPTCEYARQKSTVEDMLLQHVPASSIVRLTKVIGATHPLVKRWYADLVAGNAIEAFVDQKFAPLDVGYVANALIWIAAEKQRGIWHLSGEREITYYDFALLLSDVVEADRRLVIPKSSPTKGLPEDRRLTYTTLDCTEFLQKSGLKRPSVESLVSGLFRRTETC